VATVPIPSRERTPRHAHENFYFLQEDHLYDAHDRAGGAWSWTILRPQVILGESLGSNMNLIPAIAAYGAVLREAGKPLHFPGGAPSVIEVVSADLLASAIAWAGTSPAARNEIFNVTNGDVFVWRHAWPVVADALGMEPGEDRPMLLAEEMPRRAAEPGRRRRSSASIRSDSPPGTTRSARSGRSTSRTISPSSVSGSGSGHSSRRSSSRCRPAPIGRGFGC